MRFRTTTVLLAVFVLLGGYVYFTEYRGKEERQKKESAAKKAFPFESKDISEISLTYDGHTYVGVRKSPTDWEFSTPSGLEADSDAWESLATSITFIERKETIPGTPDVAQYGLDKPSLTVAMKLAEGKTAEIAFGSENPRKTLNYAKLGGATEVFLTESKSAVFRKTLTDLRNKKLLEIEAENVSSIRIAEGGKETMIEKSGADWTLTKPVQARADVGEVTGFLSTLQYARAVDFAEASMDPKEAGLSTPMMQLTVHDMKAGTDRVLMIGKLQAPDRYYAKEASRAAILVLEKEIPEKLRRPVFDWRDKSVVHVEHDKIDEIEIARGADKFAFKKSDADWKLSDGRKLDLSKIEVMLTTLESEKASEIVDPPKTVPGSGLDKPRLEVTLKQGGGMALRVTFGADGRAPASVYVKTSAAPAVMTVSKAAFDAFNVAVTDLLEPKPAGP